MILEDPALPLFEPVLSQFYELAQQNGFSEMEKRGYKLADFQNNPRVRRLFLRACHYGYDLAQRQIAAFAIALEDDARSLISELKACRKRRDPAARVILNRLQVNRNRLLVLRRLIDSILFAMIQGQNWLFRRFTIDMGIHRIDPLVLKRTVRVAVERNREDRLKFSFVSDLSTVVQIGDLIEIDTTARGEGKWRIVELKDGKMNEILAGLLKAQQSQAGSDPVKVAQETLGDNAARQARRMVRQGRRMSELNRIVQTDRGLDPLYEVETIMTADTRVLADYHQEIEQVYERTKQRGLASLEIDGCLRIVGISREKAIDQGRRIAAHQLLHMADRQRPCAFLSQGSSTDRSEEIAALSRVPYFVDLVDCNLNVPIADPIFAWSNRQMVFDLVMGRVRVFVQFDIEAFFLFAQHHGVKLRWIKGQEAEVVRKFSMRFPGTEDAWGILAELSGGERATLLAGFIARPYLNCTTPKEMVAMIKEWPKQLGKTDPEKILESPI